MYDFVEQNQAHQAYIMIYIAYSSRVGDHNIDQTETEEQEFAVTSIEIHRDFNVGPFLNNDIAIATLGYVGAPNEQHNVDFRTSGGIRFGQYVGAACLPSDRLR